MMTKEIREDMNMSAEDKEEYIKLSDVLAIFEKLKREPGYWHTGETFYAGVYAVESEVVDLPVIKFKED